MSRRNDPPPEASPAGASPAHTSRRDFLRKAGTAGVLLGSGSALLSACSTATGVGSGSQTSASKGTIKILLWSHFVPRYDTWYDPWAKKWGEQNGVNVVVDHINQADLAARTAAEFAAGAGHDMIEWLTPASAYEPSVHDLTDVVKQAEAKYGSQTSFCKLSSFNPHTRKYYAFCHTWTPDPGDYRKGLWTKAGLPNGPLTYADLLTGGTDIDHKQHVRMGIGMSPEVDSNMAARALIWSYGGSTQDAQGKVVLNSPETVDAVAYMVRLFKQAMTDEVFSWTAASNNQGLVAGQLSYILNSISAYRTAQTTSASVADDIFFVPASRGRPGRASPASTSSAATSSPNGRRTSTRSRSSCWTWWERRTARCTTRNCTTSPPSPTPPQPRHCPAGCRTIPSGRSPRTSSPCWPPPSNGPPTSGTQARPTRRKEKSSPPISSRP